MSTRRSVFCHGWIHLFYDVVGDAHYLDIGPKSYNHAFKVWPFTLRRLY